ncbi:hypothetical protein JZ751_014498 [Albula glossodonta]|uniref:Uncharacterized protein n=1 Tax=Albula glossodonta TaxID=121402 RepID=A0A8T2MYW7_9TELE|nr:hypothetical protein JZ751_014498 [Albula glossodonta]
MEVDSTAALLCVSRTIFTLKDVVSATRARETKGWGRGGGEVRLSTKVVPKLGLLSLSSEADDTQKAPCELCHCLTLFLQGEQQCQGEDARSVCVSLFVLAAVPIAGAVPMRGCLSRGASEKDLPEAVGLAQPSPAAADRKPKHSRVLFTCANLSDYAGVRIPPPRTQTHCVQLRAPPYWIRSAGSDLAAEFGVKPCGSKKRKQDSGSDAEAACRGAEHKVTLRY